jgi:triosephosphate isomerase
VEIRMDDTIVLANWKMNKTLEEAKSFFGDLLDLFGAERYLKIVICVPYPYVGCLSSMCKNTNIGVGAQNLFYKEWGKYTGEVSAPMLASVGCRYVMTGHSFRREAFSESDESIKSRMLFALKHEITPISLLNGSRCGIYAGDALSPERHPGNKAEKEIVEQTLHNIN